MHRSILIPLLGVAAAIFVKLVQLFVVQRQRTRTAKDKGCGAVPDLPCGFLGWDNLQRIKKADEDWKIMSYLQERQDRIAQLVGRPVNTFRWNMFGKTMIFTAEPKNIQAVLATQFNDFQLGPMRKGFMGPMVGDGIFVQGQ